MSQRIQLLLSIALFGSVNSISAQQESLFSHYNEVMEVFNPSVSGTGLGMEVTALHRTQWSGISMSPQTYVFGVSKPMSGNVGLGLNVIQEKVFIEKSTFVGVDYSYKLILDENTNLYLGLKAGLHSYEVNPNNLEDYNLAPDTSLEQFSKILPNLGAGLFLTHKKLKITMAVPRLLNTKRVQEKEGRAVFAKDRIHFYTSFHYSFDLTDRLLLDTFAVSRFVEGAPMSHDIQGRLWYNHNVMLGGSYRTDKSLTGLVQLRVYDNLFVGWAYESHSRSELANAGNSQEFMLKYRFN